MAFITGGVGGRGLKAVSATYTSTGANLVLDLGFIPVHAWACNTSVGVNFWEWNAGMSTTSGGNFGADIYGITNAAGTFATITRGTGGIVPLDGSAGTGIGLTIGTNTVINANAGHAWVVTAWQPI